MRRKHRETLQLTFSKPASGSVRWVDIEALSAELGARIEERRDSRVSVKLSGEVRVFHRPHSSPDTDKGAVADIRRWLAGHGVKP